MNSELLTLSNLRGQLRQEVLRLVDQIFRDLNAAILAPRDIEEYGTDSVIKGALHNREEELVAAEKLMSIIVQEWHAKDLSISRQDFELELSQLEDRIEHLMGDILVIRASRFELGGRLLDDKVWAEDSERSSSTRSNIDSLIGCYKTVKGAKISIFEPKSTIAQWNFCRRVFSAYGVEDGSDVWSMAPYDHYQGAQIVRYNVGESCARYLFSTLEDLDGHLMRAKNGLPMNIRYAEALDDGRLVIIPDECQGKDQKKDKGSISHWKVYNLYEVDAQKKSRLMPLGSELHGRSLQFRNDFRPDARYLFFVFCMNVLRRQRHEASGWWRDYLVAGPGKAWAEAASGTYLYPPTLQRLAQRVGRLTKEEATQFMIEAGNGGTTERSRDNKRLEERNSFYSDVCCVAAMQPSPNRFTKWTKLGKYNQSHEEVLDEHEAEESDEDDEKDENGDDDNDDDEDEGGGEDEGESDYGLGDKE